LKGTGVDAIYTSTALRTKQTAEPLARSIMVESKPLKEHELATKLNNLGQEHGDHVVVFVGHSDTVSPIIDAVMKGQSGVTIGPDDFDRMFVLISRRDGKWGLIRTRY
jgi:phosphohistidine phosphatase SixA